MSTCSVNIAEGDFIAAEFFFLVAVDHHQAVAEAIRQVTTLRLSWIPLPVDKTFVTGTPD